MKKSCKVRRRQGSRWKNALNYYKNKRWAYLLIYKILSHQLFPYLRGNLLKYTAKIDRCQIFRLLISAQPREKPSNFWSVLIVCNFWFSYRILVFSASRKLWTSVSVGDTKFSVLLVVITREKFRQTFLDWGCWTLCHLFINLTVRHEHT